MTERRTRDGNSGERTRDSARLARRGERARSGAALTNGVNALHDSTSDTHELLSSLRAVSSSSSARSPNASIACSRGISGAWP